MKDPLVNYTQLGFDSFGHSSIQSASQIPANLADYVLEVAEASVGNRKIKNLAVSNGKIVSVSADKITAGTLVAVTNIGDESIKLDGQAKTIKIFDDSSPAKVSIYMKGGSA